MVLVAIVFLGIVLVFLPNEKLKVQLEKFNVRIEDLESIYGVGQIMNLEQALKAQRDKDCKVDPWTFSDPWNRAK